MTPIARQSSQRDGTVKGQHRQFINRHAGRLRSREQTSRWNGGRILTPGGYVKVRVGKRYEWEHRLVMEQMLGRPMRPFPEETVHHKNGDPSDNRPENLELRIARSHGIGATEAHCKTCTCFGPA